MIIVMEPKATEAEIQKVVTSMEAKGFKIILNKGDVMTVIAAIGDKRMVDPASIASLEGVRDVKLVQEPYKLASREGKAEDTIIEFSNGVKIGGLEKPVLMVGPCSVEKELDGLLEVAYAAKVDGGILAGTNDQDLDLDNLELDGASKSIGKTLASNSDFLEVEITIWVEGWQEFDGSPIWDANYIDSQFDIGFEFATDID